MPKVMICLAPLGGGHQSMAQAISEGLKELEPAVEVCLVDVFSGQYSSFPLTWIPQLYSLFTVRFPFVWHTLFRSTDGNLRYTWVERTVQPFIRPKLRDAIWSQRPNVIISVFPALGYTLQQTLGDLRLRIPIGIVVADLVSIHEAWLFRSADWYAVPTNEASQTFRDAGIDPALVHVLGLPIRHQFRSSATDRSNTRHRLGLTDRDFVLLIVGGGGGVGNIESIVDGLASVGSPYRLVVVTGRNEQLRHRLERKLRNAICTILGYVVNMADWMQAADVLVTKAGPTTIFEAIHCGLPMIIYGAIPGQEEGNLAFVQSRGLGLIANKKQDIVRAVKELATNQDLVRGIKERMADCRGPDAAVEIAKLALGK